MGTQKTAQPGNPVDTSLRGMVGMSQGMATTPAPKPAAGIPKPVTPPSVVPPPPPKPAAGARPPAATPAPAGRVPFGPQQPRGAAAAAPPPAATPRPALPQIDRLGGYRQPPRPTMPAIPPAITPRPAGPSFTAGGAAQPVAPMPTSAAAPSQPAAPLEPIRPAQPPQRISDGVRPQRPAATVQAPREAYDPQMRGLSQAQERARKAYLALPPEQRAQAYAGTPLADFGEHAQPMQVAPEEFVASLADPDGEFTAAYQQLSDPNSRNPMSPEQARNFLLGHNFMARRFGLGLPPEVRASMQEAGVVGPRTPYAIAQAMKALPPEQMEALRRSQLQTTAAKLQFNAAAAPTEKSLPEHVGLWGAADMTPEQFAAVDWTDNAAIRKQFPELNAFAGRYQASVETPEIAKAIQDAYAQHRAAVDAGTARPEDFNPFEAIHQAGGQLEKQRWQEGESGRGWLRAFGLQKPHAVTGEEVLDVDPYDAANRTWAGWTGGGVGSLLDGAGGIAAAVPALAGDAVRSAYNGEVSLDLSRAAGRNLLSPVNYLFNTDIGANNGGSRGASALGMRSDKVDDAPQARAMFNRWSEPVVRHTAHGAGPVDPVTGKAPATHQPGDVVLGPNGAPREGDGQSVLGSGAAQALGDSQDDANFTTLQRAINAAAGRTLGVIDNMGGAAPAAGVGRALQAGGNVIARGAGGAAHWLRGTGAFGRAAATVPQAVANTAAATGNAANFLGQMPQFMTNPAMLGLEAGQTAIQKPLAETAADPKNNVYLRMLAHAGSNTAAIAEAALNAKYMMRKGMMPNVGLRANTITQTAQDLGQDALVGAAANAGSPKLQELGDPTPLQQLAAPIAGVDRYTADGEDANTGWGIPYIGRPLAGALNSMMSAPGFSPESRAKIVENMRAQAANSQFTRGVEPPAAQVAALDRQQQPGAEPAATPPVEPPDSPPQEAAQTAMQSGTTETGEPQPEARANVQAAVANLRNNPEAAEVAAEVAGGEVSPETQQKLLGGATAAVATELGLPEEAAAEVTGNMTPEQQFAMWGGMSLAGVGLLTAVTGGAGIVPLLMALVGGGLAAGSGGLGADIQNQVSGWAAKLFGSEFDPQIGLVGSMAMPKIEEEFAASPEAAQARSAYTAFGSAPPPADPAAPPSGWLQGLGTALSDPVGAATRAMAESQGLKSRDDVVKAVAAKIREKVESDGTYRSAAPWLKMLGGGGAPSEQQYATIARRLLERAPGRAGGG